jgi:hypothetical protein
MRRAVIYLRVSTLDQTTAIRSGNCARLPAGWAVTSSRSTRITASAAPGAAINGRPSTSYAATPRGAGYTHETQADHVKAFDEGIN